MRGAALADEARASLASAERYVESTDRPVVAGITRLVAGEVLARIGQVEQAREALADWDANYAPSEPWEPLRRRAAGALISWRTGQVHTAVAELQHVQAGFEQGEMALEAIWTQIDLGRVLLEVDRGSAAAALRAAAATASALGATTLQQLAEKELRAVGVRTWRRSKATLTGADALQELSAREREVALLVAEGASDPEIAEQLYLSRKTIEHHVSNALAKLGVETAPSWPPTSPYTAHTRATLDRRPGAPGGLRGVPGAPGSSLSPARRARRRRASTASSGRSTPTRPAQAPPRSTGSG